MRYSGSNQRHAFVGGSDARIIMGSNEAALLRLWREKRGEAEPEDLSGNLIVQLGAATEELNRSWYERNTGRHVTGVQRRVRHSAIPWMVAMCDTAALELAMMTSGPSATNSAEYFLRFSRLPAPQRVSILTFWPTIQPSCCRLCAKAARRI